MINNKKINLLIPDGEAFFSTEVIKCFSDIPFANIHIVSSKKWIESRFSHKISSFTYFKKTENDNEYIEFLRKTILNKKIHVLLPIFYSTTHLLSRYKNNFKDLNINILTPESNYLEIANNKWELAKFLNKFNLPQPYTTDLMTLKSIENLKYPFLLKPKDGSHGSNIFIVKNESEFLKIYDKLKDKDNYIIQDFIQGYDIDMSVLCKKGEILTYTIQKGYLFGSLPFRPPIGIEFLHSDEIYDTIKKLMKELDWTGVAHIDLRYDSKKDRFLIIEVNPRFWGSIHASKKVGVNFPLLYSLTSLNETYDSVQYKFIKYANNRGLLKILKSRLMLNQKKYEFPHCYSIIEDIQDPFPKIFKYLNKIYLKLT